MRTLYKFTRPATLAAMGGALALGACGQAPEADEGEGEDMEMMASDEAQDTPTDEQISEAVPGVEAVDPESDSPSNADLNDDENLEVADEDGVDEIREGDGG